MDSIDLNCDLGESFGRYTLGVDREIITMVSSVNIACGFHAGDPSIMRQTVRLAKAHGVAIGAHSGLPDLVGFGRRNLSITPQEAYDMTLYQIGALQAFCTAEAVPLRHVKPHGALYNMAAKNPLLAEAIAAAVQRVNDKLILFALSGSELVRAGERIGLSTASEVFADRTYQQDGTLTPRNQPDALVADDDAAAAQVVRMVQGGVVRSQQGTDVHIRADTVCLHGDGPHALAFAKKIRTALAQHAISVQAVRAAEV